MEDDMELTLFSAEEAFIFSENWIFLKHHFETKATDLSFLTGCYERGRAFARFWTKSFNHMYAFHIRTFCTEGSYERFECCDRRHLAICPILHCSDKVFSKITANRVKNENGIDEVEFGEYPQYAPNRDMQERLNAFYSRGILVRTGRSYTLHRQTPFSISHPHVYKEYEYKGKKYIRVKADINEWMIAYHSQSDDTGYCDGDYVWVEVSPVVWLIDDATKTLVSKVGLLSGIQFDDRGHDYDGNFLMSTMKRFLDKYMKRDLFQSEKALSVSDIKTEEEPAVELNDKSKKLNAIEEPAVELNDKSKKVNAILDEIDKLLENYYGKEDIKGKVEHLIEVYNQEIKGTNSDSSKTLTLKNKNKESLYLKLINDLEEILAKLKISSEKYKEYVKALDLVRECIEILNGTDSELSDDITNDIKTIRDVILPFLDDKSKKQELLNIFLEEEKNIIDYLRGNDNNPISKCTTYDEFKIRIRIKMHKFLLGVSADVRTKDLISEITKGYQELSKGNFRAERNDYIGNILSEIQNCIRIINTMGNDSDKQKLEDILKNRTKVDENDLVTSITGVRELLIAVYGIVLDIEEREQGKKEVDDYTITVSKRNQ